VLKADSEEEAATGWFAKALSSNKKR
jgi:hypothetical protein